LSGCGGNSPSSTSGAPTKTNTAAVAPAAAGSFPGLPTKAQPKLQTMKLWLGPEEMITEIAADDPSRMTGMMFRTNMAENEGMLFVFPMPHQTSFWMMNTKIPLSAAYIDPEGTILEIHKLEPENTNSVRAASARIQFVLETPQGWFERHNVRTGAVIRTEFGSLPDVFLKRRATP
jgi:uncharacterized membrane protein (UPF0127 family)